MVDLWCVIVPFAFSFYPKIQFYKQWRYFLVPCLATAFFFLVWDVAFTKAGIWSFNPLYVSGLYIAGLPIEEILFFICIPYSCVFTYYCIRLFFTFPPAPRSGAVISGFLAISLAFVGFSHLHQYYTSSTFILLTLFLAFLIYRRATYLPAFYVSFLIILIPFFISNGVLTGSFLNRTVVMYNNEHNLAIRMLTIPVEDTFYGMLLLLMNVAGFEYKRNKTPKVR